MLQPIDVKYPIMYVVLRLIWIFWSSLYGSAFNNASTTNSACWQMFKAVCSRISLKNFFLVIILTTEGPTISNKIYLKIIIYLKLFGEKKCISAIIRKVLNYAHKSKPSMSIMM